MAEKQLAKTTTEQSEAEWFEQNQDRLLELFQQAGKDGSLVVGATSVGITISRQTGEVKKPASRKVMLRIPTDDVDRARRLAADRGIGYQTLIKMLLRAGLDREEKRARRA